MKENTGILNKQLIKSALKETFKKLNPVKQI